MFLDGFGQEAGVITAQKKGVFYALGLWSLVLPLFLIHWGSLFYCGLGNSQLVKAKIHFESGRLLSGNRVCASNWLG